jgi:hypothetical protein
MKQLLKILQPLLSTTPQKAHNLPSPLAEERIPESEIILDVKRRAFNAAANLIKKEDFRKSILLETQGRVTETKADYSERIAVVQERINEDTAYLSEISNNRDKHIQIEVANMPEDRHQQLDKLAGKITTLKHKINSLKLELLHLKLQ